MPRSTASRRAWMVLRSGCAATRTSRASSIVRPAAGGMGTREGRFRRKVGQLLDEEGVAGRSLDHAVHQRRLGWPAEQARELGDHVLATEAVPLGVLDAVVALQLTE